MCVCVCLCEGMLVWIGCAVGKSIGVLAASHQPPCFLACPFSFCPRLFMGPVLNVDYFHGVPPSQPNAIFFTWQGSLPGGSGRT